MSGRGSFWTVPLDVYKRQELETLNTRLEELKEKQQQNALSRQQYESQIQILEEQIHAGRQNSDHYRNRLGVLKEELEKREKEKETLTQEKEALHEKLREQRNRLKEENNRLETIQAEVAACTSAVEEGKNEIIEILNSRATTKGKAQRFDAMMEQLDIRKAAVSQRILRLKTEEAVSYTHLDVYKRQIIGDEDKRLSVKIDVFALGLIFHQILTGELPDFDHDKYHYVFEALLDKGEVRLHHITDSGNRMILEKMLVPDPEKRISLAEFLEKDVYKRQK